MRWSWLHWWEANRSLYLNTSLQGRNLQGSPQGSADLRAKAIDALIAMLDDPIPEPRAAAALALGRMRASQEPKAIEALIQLAENDSHEWVRARALLAIGLIGGDAGEAFFLQYEPPTPYLRASALVSMGLLQDHTQRISDGLNRELNRRVPSASNAAWWALSQHPDNTHAEAARQLFQSTNSPWLASAALLSLRKASDRLSDRILAHVLLNEPNLRQVPAWNLLTQVARAKPLAREATVLDGVDPKKLRTKNRGIPPLRQWFNQHKRVFDLEPTPIANGARPKKYKRMEPVTGIEAIYKTRLRISAAIAMSGAQNSDLAVEALTRLVREQDSKYNTPPKCFALVSLARIGSPKSLEVLLSVAGDTNGRRIKRQKDLESPLRGFAMIALGLYTRSQATEQGPYDRPGYQLALEMLQQRLTDKREKLEVRTAAAVALGLSGRTENLKLLIGGYEHFDDTSPLLGGYVLLGRALLGDRNVIEPARAALDRKPHHDKTTDLLARRAAVLSLGVAGTSEAIPHLIWAWDQSFYVNREVIVALSLCDASGVAVHLLPRLSGDANQYERAFMAEAVGRLLNPDKLPPLSVFLIDSNFTMKNGLLEPYRALENQFLYDYLIPEFQEVWY